MAQWWLTAGDKHCWTRKIEGADTDVVEQPRCAARRTGSSSGHFLNGFRGLSARTAAVRKPLTTKGLLDERAATAMQTLDSKRIIERAHLNKARG
jgi:hypothetical protein